MKILLFQGDLAKNEPTVLVFDNQSYNEETKSGKGQTHIAAGIAIKRNGAKTLELPTPLLVKEKEV